MNDFNTKSSIIGMSIVGHSGSGKSATIKEFRRLIEEDDKYSFPDNSIYEQQNVVWTDLPSPDHGIKGFYEAILSLFSKIHF